MKGNLTRAGLLTAVGLIAAWLESLILPPMPVPGAKVGLANVATLAALYLMGPGPAAMVTVARVLLANALFGSLASCVYALAGGVCAWGAMALLKRVERFSPGVFPRREAARTTWRSWPWRRFWPARRDWRGICRY